MEEVILKLGIQPFTVLVNLMTVLCGGLPGLGHDFFFVGFTCFVCLCMTKNCINWKMSLLPELIT